MSATKGGSEATEAKLDKKERKKKTKLKSVRANIEILARSADFQD